jgi:ethanolamine utilization protein EutN
VDLARIIGTVVAVEKDPLLEGQKLAIVQPLNEALEPLGAPLVATDLAARHGSGELVFLVRSGDAMPTGFTAELIPTDAAVVGIVDEIKIERPRPASSSIG